MPANAAPFTARLRIYPGANPAANADDWGAGVDISSYIRHPGQDGGQAITYSGGRQDESSRMDSGALDLTLDNRLGYFSTDNPLGPWYEDLDLNTPLTFGTLVAHDAFGRVTAGGWGNADSGHLWVPQGSSTPLSTDGSAGVMTFPTANASCSVTLLGSDAADVDGYFTCWSPVVATGGPILFSALARWSGSTSYYMFRTELAASGAMAAKIYKYNTTFNEVAAVNVLPLTYVANERIRTRFQADGNALRMKVWKEADDEPEEWTLTAVDTALSSGRVGMNVWRFNTNTNPGTITGYVDDITVDANEFVGTVVRWPVRWDMSGNNCWAPIQATGILRRLRQQGADLKSALTQQLTSYSPTAWWTLEDSSGATTLAAQTVNTAPATFTDASPGADSTLAGSATSVVLSSDTGMISGNGPTQAGGTGFSAMFLAKLGGPLSGKTQLATFSGVAGRIRRWVVLIDATVVYLEGYEASGTKTVDSSAVHGISDGQWVAWQLETEVVGANTNWAFILHVVGSFSYGALSGSYASTIVSRVDRFTLGGSLLNGTAFSQVWLGPNTLPFVTASFSAVSDGYRGEHAMARAMRICEQVGIPLVAEPYNSDPMGPQRPGKILDTLHECADADYGILYERGTGLGFRPRLGRYSQPVLLPLSVAAGEISQPPEPVRDDQRIRNDWKVERIGGSYARAYDQAHIDKHGLYEDSTSINVHTDEVLSPHAGWRLYLGTRPVLRWPGITLDFARNPDLLPYWRARTYGPRLTVATGLAQVAGSDPDVIAEGWTGTFHPTGWSVRLNCSAAAPWDITELDDDLTRLDVDSELIYAVDSTATTLAVACTVEEPVWADTATYPAEFPFTLLVSGEEMSCTAASTDFVLDSFTRSVGPGWGNADSGQAWTITGGGVASDYDVNGSVGVHNLSTTNVERASTLVLGAPINDVYLTAHVPAATTGSGATTEMNVRVGTHLTYVGLNISIPTSGTSTCWVTQVVDGSETIYDPMFPSTLVGITTRMAVRFQIGPSVIRGKVWPSGSPEPVNWTTELAPTQPPAIAGDIRLRSWRSASSTNPAPFWIEWDALHTPQCQRLTVTRSTNGVVKPQKAGARVSLARPMILAL